MNNSKNQNTQVAYILTPKGFSIFIDDKSYVVDQSHPNYTKISERLKDENYVGLVDLIDTTKTVTKLSNGLLKVSNGVVYYDGRQLNGVLVDTILKLIKGGFSVQPIVNFLNNLEKNPSKRAVDELYEFLAVGQIPITPDGFFVAYKKVRSNYFDIHSGTFDNSVGQVCEMPRNKVDENSERTCSAGLHVCSYDYLKHFSSCSNDRVVICKINPADVVAIPKDYNNSKMRVCRYEVVAEDLEYWESDNLAKTTLYGASDDDLYEYDCDGEYCDDCEELLEECTCGFDDGDDEYCDDCQYSSEQVVEQEPVQDAKLPLDTELSMLIKMMMLYSLIK